MAENEYVPTPVDVELNEAPCYVEFDIKLDGAPQPNQFLLFAHSHSGTTITGGFSLGFSIDGGLKYALAVYPSGGILADVGATDFTADFVHVRAEWTGALLSIYVDDEPVFEDVPFSGELPAIAGVGGTPSTFPFPLVATGSVANVASGPLVAVVEGAASSGGSAGASASGTCIILASGATQEVKVEALRPVRFGLVDEPLDYSPLEDDDPDNFVEIAWGGIYAEFDQRIADYDIRSVRPTVDIEVPADTWWYAMVGVHHYRSGAWRYDYTYYEDDFDPTLPDGVRTVDARTIDLNGGYLRRWDSLELYASVEDAEYPIKLYAIYAEFTYVENYSRASSDGIATVMASATSVAGSGASVADAMLTMEASASADCTSAAVAYTDWPGYDAPPWEFELIHTTVNGGGGGWQDTDKATEIDDEPAFRQFTVAETAAFIYQAFFTSADVPSTAITKSVEIRVRYRTTPGATLSIAPSHASVPGTYVQLPGSSDYTKVTLYATDSTASWTQQRFQQFGVAVRAQGSAGSRVDVDYVAVRVVYALPGVGPVYGTGVAQATGHASAAGKLEAELALEPHYPGPGSTPTGIHSYLNADDGLYNTFESSTYGYLKQFWTSQDPGIPPTAVVTGVFIEYEQVAGGTGVLHTRLYTTWEGTAVAKEGTTYASSVGHNSIDITHDRPGGGSWTPADLPNIGVRIQRTSGSYILDYVRIVVLYAAEPAARGLGFSNADATPEVITSSAGHASASSAAEATGHSFNPNAPVIRGYGRSAIVQQSRAFAAPDGVDTPAIPGGPTFDVLRIESADYAGAYPYNPRVTADLSGADGVVVFVSTAGSYDWDPTVTVGGVTAEFLGRTSPPGGGTTGNVWAYKLLSPPTGAATQVSALKSDQYGDRGRIAVLVCKGVSDFGFFDAESGGTSITLSGITERSGGWVFSYAMAHFVSTLSVSASSPPATEIWQVTTDVNHVTKIAEQPYDSVDTPVSVQWTVPFNQVNGVAIEVEAAPGGPGEPGEYNGYGWHTAHSDAIADGEVISGGGESAIASSVATSSAVAVGTRAVVGAATASALSGAEAGAMVFVSGATGFGGAYSSAMAVGTRVVPATGVSAPASYADALPHVTISASSSAQGSSVASAKSVVIVPGAASATSSSGAEARPDDLFIGAVGFSIGHSGATGAPLRIVHGSARAEGVSHSIGTVDVVTIDGVGFACNHSLANAIGVVIVPGAASAGGESTAYAEGTRVVVGLGSASVGSQADARPGPLVVNAACSATGVGGGVGVATRAVGGVATSAGVSHAIAEPILLVDGYGYNIGVSISDAVGYRTAVSSASAGATGSAVAKGTRAVIGGGEAHTSGGASAAAMVYVLSAASAMAESHSDGVATLVVSSTATAVAIGAATAEPGGTSVGAGTASGESSAVAVPEPLVIGAAATSGATSSADGEPTLALVAHAAATASGNATAVADPLVVGSTAYAEALSYAVASPIGATGGRGYAGAASSADAYGLLLSFGHVATTMQSSAVAEGAVEVYGAGSLSAVGSADAVPDPLVVESTAGYVATDVSAAVGTRVVVSAGAAEASALATSTPRVIVRSAASATAASSASATGIHVHVARANASATSDAASTPEPLEISASGATVAGHTSTGVALLLIKGHGRSHRSSSAASRGTRAVTSTASATALSSVKADGRAVAHAAGAAAAVGAAVAEGRATSENSATAVGASSAVADGMQVVLAVGHASATSTLDALPDIPRVDISPPVTADVHAQHYEATLHPTVLVAEYDTQAFGADIEDVVPTSAHVGGPAVSADVDSPAYVAEVHDRQYMADLPISPGAIAA